MYNHLWAVDKEGSYYTLKNGHTTEASYLQTPANSTTGESVFTASSKGSTANWILEPYTGDLLQTANFTTYTSNMIVGEEFTFHARMYSSSIGVNGPVQYLVLNADGTATDKATINSSTGKIQALKPGEIRVGATFSGTTTYWYRPVTIEESLEGTCYFHNKQYEKYYMQIDDGASASGEGAIMELHMFDGGGDQKWILEYISNGYYKIISQTNGKVITAPNYLNDAVTLQLYSGADTQQWKFISVGDGTYHISPRFSPSSYLAAGDGLDTELFIKGRNVELRTSQSDFKDEWYVNEHRISFANVNSYYDNGYSVYYGETNEISQSKINEYMSNIAKRYQDIFGLYLSVNSTTYYSSPIDICKGTVSATNINTLCYHNPVHTDRNNMIDWFGQLFIGNTLTTNVYWSCHKIRSIATNGSTDYNRSCSSGYSIIMIERSSSLNRDLYSQGVLMHELNHQYGARDHYHELADGKDPNSCKFKDICSYCGTNPRPSSCIMYDSRIDINSSTVVCSECQSDIFAHLDNHH